MGQHWQFVPQQNRPQMMQHPSHQMAMQHQSSQMAPPQGHQYAYQHMQYMAYQPSGPPQGQQSTQQLAPPYGAQHQGKHYPNREDHKAEVAKKEDAKLGNQSGLSSAQFQQLGTPSSQNHSAGANSGQMPQTGLYMGQAQQFTCSSVNMQQPTSMGQSQQTGTYLVWRQQDHRFQNQMGPSSMLSNMPPPGLDTGYDDKLHGRSGNDYYNNSKNGAMMGQQKPSLSAILMISDLMRTCTRRGLVDSYLFFQLLV